jgi:hypothetical protein
MQKLAAKYQPGNGTLIDEIQEAKYMREDLQPTVNKMNGADNYTPTLSKKSVGVRFFVGGGLNNNTTKFEAGDLFSGSKSSSSIYPQINLGTDIFINKYIGDLVLRVEFTFTGNKASFAFNGLSSDVPYTSILNFNQYIVSVNPQIIYHLYNKDDIKLYLAVGAALNFSINTNKLYSVTYSYGSGNTTTPFTFPPMQSIFFDATTKAGLVLNNKFDIYLGYNPAISVSNYTPFNINLTVYKIGINYLFGIK